ncbi:DUF4278 domain-containing protein [Argonema antarcticum]|uniref:DUF4278 domain-containing protein n=1 Tax=Argonema antarcticum TaxID=2942763 RepID=UPI002011E8DC|nr:DUF4278 domain-containing protein [Argonema antarcticum]MCL1469723.1 DUF4278 domain-containing protein [Argonema antarcticum A004/B2]
MAFFFVVPLGIVLVAIYIFKKSADEMAYLAATISLVALILSLIIAPWQLQVSLLLLVLLITSKRLLLFFEPRSESEPDKTAKLIYRGVNYEHSSGNLEVTEGEIAGKYRGQIWKSCNVEKTPEIQPNFELKYRGMSVNCQKPVTPLVEESVVGEDLKTSSAPIHAVQP